MENIKVRAEIDYEVIVGGEWLSFLQTVQRSHRKVLIIAPDFIAESAGLREITKGAGIFLFVTPDGESQKDYSTVERIWNFLGSESFGRNDAIVAMGGGATTDLAGFVAATPATGVGIPGPLPKYLQRNPTLARTMHAVAAYKITRRRRAPDAALSRLNSPKHSLHEPR